MSKFNLVTIRPPGFLHSSAFAEVKESLAWSLTALGHEVISVDNGFSASAQNIIFGAELIPAGSTLPPGAIVYNLEQPSHPNMPAVRSLAKGHTVWDYSQQNVTDWQALGFDCRHLPIGYTPNLPRIPKAATQDIDVAFFGWLTTRRVALLDQLRASGLKVFSSDSCYGASRDQILSRTKVCLNVHHDGRDRFEIVRCSYLLANGKCVVTERSSDDQEYSYLNGSLKWFEYGNLVDGCISLVTNSSGRASLEQDAWHAMEKLDFTESVARVLDNHQPTSSHHSLIQARYEAGLKSGDMADFLPWLRDHAKGRILEIGTRDGASTSAFLLGLEKHGGHLTSLDIADCSALWSHPQWTFHKANSLTAQFPDASFDLALIDGDHSDMAFRGDLYNCYHWVRPGGLILAHDITPERGHEFYAVGIRREWDAFLRVHPELKHYILPGKYGLGVIER